MIDKIDNASLDITLKIAKERSNTLESLKQALLKDDDSEIKHYAKQICGINNESN